MNCITTPLDVTTDLTTTGPVVPRQQVSADGLDETVDIQALNLVAPQARPIRLSALIAP
jgi:hypothetical protein